MAGTQLDTAWLEEGKDMAECPVCLMVLGEPTVGCPEGHTLCRRCYIAELQKRQQCPVCSHATDESRLQRCRPLEGLIGQLRTRCKNGPDDLDCHGGGQGGAAPRAKRAKLEPAHQRNDAGQEGAQRCSWRGRVCELVGHLSESCGFEAVKCPNAVASCTESVLRKDAARHASETCVYRTNRFDAHGGSWGELGGGCPEAQVGRRDEERAARAEVGDHVEGHTSGALHQRSGRRAATEMEDQVVVLEEKVDALDGTLAGQSEALQKQGSVIVKQRGDIAGLQEKVGGQGRVIGTLRGEIAGLRGDMEKQHAVVATLQQKVAEQALEMVGQTSAIHALQRRAEALTRVFTWSTDAAWSGRKSLPYTFTDGVRGHCFNGKPGDKTCTYGMGFALEEGPACTMHFKCSVLDKDDKVLRFVSGDKS
ncbi:hypothetical protein T484DRAFT_1851979 [Baffinella frigidus]|nr:hypothetical protein T484DRAFT_1851979 [Cryptophyta sp. CCMP2293]